MKTVSHACITLLVGLLPHALGQGSIPTSNLAPSPTESVGCEAHGDHWHCDGPRVTSTFLTSGFTTPPPAVTSSPAQLDHDHDHDDHDDHDEDHDHDHEDDHHDNVSLGPSPTASVGCVPHGDHWDCEGPATSTPTQSVAETQAVPSGASTVSTSAATHHGIGLLSIFTAATLGVVFAL